MNNDVKLISEAYDNVLRREPIEVVLERAKQGDFTTANLGYMNGWGDDAPDNEKWQIYHLHSMWMKKNPEKHHMTEQSVNSKGTDNRYTCSCGFKYAVDSSD